MSAEESEKQHLCNCGPQTANFQPPWTLGFLNPPDYWTIVPQTKWPRTQVITAATPTRPTVQQSMPPKYLVLGIFTLICCCLHPFGIFGLFYSLKVEQEWRNQNVEGAEKAFKLAKNWSIAGILVVILYIIFIVSFMTYYNHVKRQYV